MAGTLATGGDEKSSTMRGRQERRKMLQKLARSVKSLKDDRRKDLNSTRT